ncbi:PucR family transcriptional regulator [Blastococcus haudaquaticus]|uniref:DNA-binding transcriptional regulator, PucR family n=1 Tax=Blastococcus haudaquaticus TaxID=1938745 RepID=A0A286H423_9ACTN|nr:helix-turn-helix domain-containing protein [Blastococcus haudaquaticus]SOE02507.1 DNA-binding transcriptional regulator, PucR family [Blastococcus haudaquaticus]
MRDDLQELVDEVSRVLAAPATLEDADFTLLAFCAHDDSTAGAMDAVRTRSILTRGSPAPTRAWFEEFGIASAEGPLRTPADPVAGILTRLVLPVRHAGRTRGYLWLLDDGRIDPDDDGDPALAAAVELAADAGRLLADRAAAPDDLGRPLSAALTGTGNARTRGVRELTDALGDALPLVVVALVAGPPGLPERWRRPGAGAVATVLDDPAGPVGAVLVPLTGSADLRPAGALAAASLAGLPTGSTAGVSEVREGVADLAAQWGQARAAARVAGAVPQLSPVAHWAELGAWRTASALTGPDPVVVPLLSDVALARTAEVFLDCAGSASRAAAELRVHRQTLYYRLARIEELTGLDLADGGARLLLHASLRAARLAAH